MNTCGQPPVFTKNTNILSTNFEKWIPEIYVTGHSITWYWFSHFIVEKHVHFIEGAVLGDLWSSIPTMAEDTSSNPYTCVQGAQTLVENFRAPSHIEMCHDLAR